MNTDDLDQALRETLSGAAPTEIHDQTDKFFRALANQARQAEAERPAPTRRAIWSWWLWPGVSLAGAVTAAILLFGIFVSSTVSWAQVEERFRALHFFGVTVYFARNPAQPPEKIELWATQDHRTRVHYRGLVVFGQADQPARVLRAETGEEIPADELKLKSMEKDFPALDLALHMHEGLSRMPQFSLDEVLATFSGKRQDLRPVPNVDASIATDLQVFDLATTQSPAWVRFWVLKKSELPVRIRSLDPSGGEQVEAVFDYFTKMPDEAFDAAKVQVSIRARQGGANRQYALLKDPGGRPLTPGDVFAGAGFHLPEVAAAGRTADGVLWVQSHKAQNRCADGRTFDGWGKLTDDLGQSYLRVWVASRIEGDLQEEYYIPLNYQAGYRKPASYTLTCWDGMEGWQIWPVHIVGSTEVKQWAENAPIPKVFDSQDVPKASDLVQRLLAHHVQLEDWERFDALAATIPGTPEESPQALFRDLLLTRKLEAIRQREQAAALRARLFPLIKDPAKTAFPEAWDVMEDYLCDLLVAGQRETARSLANEFIAHLPVEREIHIGRLIHKLHRAGMTQDDIRKFFDEDVFSLPRVKEDLGRFPLNQNAEWTPATNPGLAVWREYLSRLSARYDRQPEPAECELIDEAPTLPKDQWWAPLPLPGHSELKAYFFASTDVETLALQIAQQRDLDPAQVIVSRSGIGSLHPTVCVYRATLESPQIWAAYLDHEHLRIEEKTTRRPVLVAKYNGQKLPSAFEVAPLDGTPFGTAPGVQEGGTGANAAHVLKCFADSLNIGRPADDPRRVLLVDETGLPEHPGPNQSQVNVCLAYQFGFWSGEAARQAALAWFRSNFGITFQEEEREVKVLELHTSGKAG